MEDPSAREALEAHREKRLVALGSLGAAVALTAMKLVVGFSTGSIGILSEAAHSGLDLVAAAVTSWAVWASARPPDHDHPYGHGKIENFSALLETGLLLATCAWITFESVQRLFFEDVHVEATPWAFAVMGVSIVIDLSRSRALARAARKYRSQALEADALHFSTDVWSSSVVIGGLALVLLAERAGLPWLARADAAAALGVAGIVVWVSVRLGKKSVDDLLDAVPPGLAERVASAARVPGVVEVGRVRLRRGGPDWFADVTLRVARGASFERAHAISHAAEVAILEVIPGADVVVHADPVRVGDEGLVTAVRLAAARHALPAHAVRLFGDEGARTLELHVEVPDTLTLHEARARVEELESELRASLPGVAVVTTRVEAVPVATLADPPPAPGDEEARHR